MGGGDRDAKNTCKKCGHVKENGTVSIICPKPECQSMKWVLDDPDAIDGLKIKVSEVCGDCNSHIWDTAKAEWRKIEGFSRGDKVPAKINGTQCTCKGTGRKMVNGKPHEETVSIQARTKAFSNTIKEFVMKRYPPNKEILHFAVEYVVSNNVAPFDNQGESMEQAQGVSVEPAVVNQGDPVEPAVVNQGDPVEPAVVNQSDPVEQAVDNQREPVEQAVLLDLTRTSKWKRIKNRWFITTDRNTKMFLKYLTERKRFAFRNRTHAKIARNEDIIRKL